MCARDWDEKEIDTFKVYLKREKKKLENNKRKDGEIVVTGEWWLYSNLYFWQNILLYIIIKLLVCHLIKKIDFFLIYLW
jgi:hypothetical protein